MILFLGCVIFSTSGFIMPLCRAQGTVLHKLCQDGADVSCALAAFKEFVLSIAGGRTNVSLGVKGHLYTYKLSHQKEK